MPTSQAKDKLLAEAVGYALDHGITDLSLREIAAAIGSSHRMLIYHFGSRQGLLVEVAKAVEQSERSYLLETMGEGDPKAFWLRIRDQRMWPQERLFFELYAHALLKRPGTEGFLNAIVDSWVTPVAEALIEAGIDPEVARAEARLSVAVGRGLLLDVLATGDTGAVDAAFDRYVEGLMARLNTSGPPTAT
ncbi:MAG TPA: TetR/AcrR family transcriptional regulator [Acidimicrobiales bacterium]|nr:TetR/AcrR family transcriptional regulator [Acidimicrobiales bacterium]